MKFVCFYRDLRGPLTFSGNHKVVLRPPARSGDLYQAQLDGADGIIVIDEDFSEIGPKYHEYIYLLQKGLPIVGVGYVGALRAAELNPYGMLGFGKVYESLLTTENRNLSEVLSPPSLENQNTVWCSTEPATQWQSCEAGTRVPESKAEPFKLKATVDTNTVVKDILGLESFLETLSRPRLKLVGNRNAYAFYTRLQKQFKLRPPLHRLAFGAPAQNKNLNAHIIDRIAYYLWLSKELNLPIGLFKQAEQHEKIANSFFNCLGLCRPSEFTDEYGALTALTYLMQQVLADPWIQQKLTPAYLLKNKVLYKSLLLDSGDETAHMLLTLEDSLWVTENLLENHLHLDHNWISAASNYLELGLQEKSSSKPIETNFFRVY